MKLSLTVVCAIFFSALEIAQCAKSSLRRSYRGDLAAKRRLKKTSKSSSKEGEDDEYEDRDGDGSDGGAVTPLPPPGPSLWEVITARSAEFSTFIAVAELAGYDSVLMDKFSEATVFLPNDAAFGAVQPPDLLTKYLDVSKWGPDFLGGVLDLHLVSGATVNSTMLVNDTVVVSTDGPLKAEVKVTLPPPQLFEVGMDVKANIVEVDIPAANGVIHVIDQVMLPPFLDVNIVEAADALGDFTILLELAEIAGLVDLLTGPGPLAIFAPPDSVFQSFGDEFVNALRNDPEDTRKILRNHILVNKVFDAYKSQVFVSAAGFGLTLGTRMDGGYLVNGVDSAPGLGTILVNNGKIGVITGLLVPPL